MSIIIILLSARIGFEYLGVDPVAHRVGMGYALYGDGYSVHYNPGGLAFSEDPRYSFAYLSYIAGTHLGYLGYERSRLGIGLRYLYSGSMKKTDALGNEYGSFSSNFLDLNIGKGFTYKDCGLGLSIKGVYANIDTLFSFGVGIDLGAVYVLAGPGIQLGLAVKNIGYGFKPFIDNKETFPYEINIGAIKRFPQGWVGMDLFKPALTGLGLRLGGAYSLTSNFTVKTAYNTLMSSMRTGSSGLDILAGITIGMTVSTRGITVGYSYSPYFDLGGGHRLSISLGG